MNVCMHIICSYVSVFVYVLPCVPVSGYDCLKECVQFLLTSMNQGMCVLMCVCMFACMYVHAYMRIKMLDLHLYVHIFLCSSACISLNV